MNGGGPSYHEIYKLGVVNIPTNMPLIREDQSDLIYKTRGQKYIAVVDDVAERYAKDSRKAY